MAQSQLQGVSIVLLGSFNPAIFHPSWFAAHNLLRESEAEAASINIVHQDVTDFKMDWLNVNVVKQRLQLSTVQESFYETLRDTAVGILGLLSHTPVKLMGINRDFHFDLVTEDDWNNLGHHLVPKEDWKSFLKTPGMQMLVVQGERPDDFKGYLRVQVEPSTRIKYGVFIMVNDHYKLRESDDKLGGAEAARIILSEQWNNSMKRSLEIAETVSKMGKK